MAKEMLDSDKVNYLIWRYLVESDYSETAVRLQKEWDIRDPQELPFAPHVKNHALVAVLNRGLLYNVQERELVQQQQQQPPPPPPRAVAAPAPGFFGPLVPASPAEMEEEEDHENLRKHPIDTDQPPQQSGPPLKRPRLSNGYEPGLESSTPMDVDDEANLDENAYPSPEQVPSPVVATAGPETGTQIDRVHDLSPATVFLELSEDPSSKNVVLLQCEFNPQHPSILAAAGTDALARMWTLPHPSPDSGSVSPGTGQGRAPCATHAPLLEDGASPNTTVTGLAWSPDGSHIAVASEPLEDGSARIEFWHRDSSLSASFNGFDSPVICLRWNESSQLCLALSPQDEGKGAALTVMHPTSDTSASLGLPNHSLLEQPLDAVWTGAATFCVCGGNLLQEFTFNHRDNAIAAGGKFATRPGELLSRITFDPPSRMLATASDSGTIGIWEPSGQCRSLNAHQGLITSLVWQPPQPRAAPDAERFLASAGEDGAISLWDVRSPDTKSKASMTMGSAVVALAFSPDGAYLAGGTNERILIWNAEDVSLPRATWTRGDELGWRTPQSHDSGSDENEDQFSLCWDADGQRLAYGVNSRLAVINFPVTGHPDEHGAKLSGRGRPMDGVRPPTPRQQRPRRPAACIVEANQGTMLPRQGEQGRVAEPAGGGLGRGTGPGEDAGIGSSAPCLVSSRGVG
ncbi:hypothetical protein B2J93_8530 [Marssonina coronariae]|uniref:LisH domain-containing protein n=1 Tax=Diplocarpon coronariae TaxID=2795749 RepID=A0A218ZDQ6_9HELO|nr:hypothetical protein B2J93_8530 [Marssonina coronariae]